MKFVLLDIQDLEKTYKHNTYKIYDDYYLDELIIDKKHIVKAINCKGCFSKVLQKVYARIIRKKILGKSDIEENWNYEIASDIDVNSKECKYVEQIIKKLGGKRHIYKDEMNINITKYIDYYAQNQSIKNYEMKMLLVQKHFNNINFDVIERCIERYKRVDIYVLEKVNSVIIDNIARINKQKGANIELVKYNKKAFLDYNIIYYVDDIRENHPRMRISKTALVIDNNTSKCDKYNSNVIFCNKIKQNIAKWDDLTKRYGVICVASAVRKIVN